MNEALVNLLPLMIGAAVVPLYPIIVLLLLQGQGGLGKASAFVVGNISVRLLQGVLFLFVFSAAEEAYPTTGPSLITATLLLVIGIMLLVTGYKKWRKEEDPDAPPPEWMNKISDLSLLKAFGAGALLVVIAVKQWVFTLAAIAVIETAGLDGGSSAILYLIFTLATQVLVLVPLLAFAVAPGASAKPLAAIHGWLQQNNRVIMIAVSLIFGLLFFYNGVTGLMAFRAP
jgi:hypothetical protein